MNAFLQTLRSLGAGRLIALGVVGLGTLGLIIFMTTRLTTPNMTLLYGDLQTADSKRIIQQLEAQQIPYQLTNNGANILVPADQQMRLRVQMADTVTGGASVGYEIFDQQSSLGTTNFIQDVNLLRALEGELARTITSMQPIQAARVHLVLPKREMFTRQQRQPSASVILKLAGANISPEAVMSVQSLVAAAVPQMQPNQVNIVDDKGTLLARVNDNPQTLMARNALEQRQQYELKLTQAVEQLLGRSLGPGNVRAEVTVEMDMNRVITNTESFDPETQVARSTVVVEESATSNEVQPDTVSVGQNLPDAQFQDVPTAQAGSEQSRIEETTNFEISRTVTNQVKEIGNVKRVSVAVMVNGQLIDGQYQPRPPEEMDKIAALVRSAVGYDANRGDLVEVVNMRFADLTDQVDAPAEWSLFGFSKTEVLRMAEGLGVAVVAILIILLVVRPLITRAFESLPEATEASGRGLLEEGGAQAALAGPGGGRAMAPAGSEPEDMDVEELIDIDKVEGRVKASSLRKIGEIVDKHPDEALNIVRNWLYAGEPP